MKNVIQILQITPEHRSKIITDTYIAWCIAHVPNPKALQMALSNQRLANYFIDQYKALEHQFCLQTQIFNVNWTRNTCMDNYINITNQIFKRYPKSLLPKVTIKEKQSANVNYN